MGKAKTSYQKYGLVGGANQGWAWGWQKGKRMFDLDIRDLRDCDNGELLGYYCRDHVDRAKFIQGLMEEWVIESVAIPENAVRHVVARWMPYRGQYGYGLLVYPAKPGRGAFPMTVWESGQ